MPINDFQVWATLRPDPTPQPLMGLEGEKGTNFTTALFIHGAHTQGPIPYFPKKKKKKSIMYCFSILLYCLIVDLKG